MSLTDQGKLKAKCLHGWKTPENEADSRPRAWKDLGAGSADVSERRLQGALGAELPGPARGSGGSLWAPSWMPEICSPPGLSPEASQLSDTVGIGLREKATEGTERGSILMWLLASWQGLTALFPLPLGDQGRLF